MVDSVCPPSSIDGEISTCRRTRSKHTSATVAFVFVILLLSRMPAFGFEGNPRFGRLSLDEGLSSSSVLCILQDSRGFLWLGTEAGLNRYDGNGFVHYRHDPETPGSLPHDYILDIVEDPSGDLWIATDGGGLGLWNHRTDSFSSFTKENTAPDGLTSNAVRTLRFDADGLLWIGTRDGGLISYDPVDESWRSFRHDPDDPTSLANDAVYAIWIDDDGTTWVGTDGGLCRFDPTAATFTRFRNDPDVATSLSDDWVRTILRDRNGHLWIGTWHAGLNRFDPSTSRFIRYRHDPDDPRSLSNDRVRVIFEDRAGRLWIGTVGGLNLFDRTRREFANFLHSPSDPTTLSLDDITVIYQDHGEILWFGTQGGGLNTWDPTTLLFGHVTGHGETSGVLSNRNIASFSEDRAGRLWVGTYGGGLNIMDRSSGQFVQQLPGIPDLESAISIHVMALLHDSSGIAWIGTSDRGLFRWDSNSNTLTSFRYDPEDTTSLGADGITSLFEDRQHRLWIGTFGGGLNLFDAATETFVRYQHDPSDPTSLSAPWVMCIAQDPGGLLWLGTHTGGLNLFDPRTGTARRFEPDPDVPRSLRSDTVVALLVRPAGDLWIATRGGGIGHIERAPRADEPLTVTTYNTAAGLPSNVVYGIQEDPDGGLWLSSDSGIARFDPISGSVRTFGPSHGLQARDFNFGAHFKSADGQLFFGGVNGFNAFYPQRITEAGPEPRVVLTSILKFNQPTSEYGPPYMLGEIDLGYRDDMVTFEFAVLDFASPGQNRYAYMLEGFHDDWIDLGNIHRVTFTDLDGGRYVLRLRAANRDGTWNDNAMSLAIHVAPPPWKSWWAYLIYAAVAVGGVLMFVQAQQRKLRRQEEYAHRLELEVDERTKELAQRNLDLEAANEQLAEASLTDSLTGLRNRRYLFEDVAKEIALVLRQYREAEAGTRTAELRDIMFIMIDLDNFKPINDNFGHPAGDRVLIQLRDVLVNACRTSDMVIRWGGDEFLIVGRDADAASAEAVAERVRADVEAHPFVLDDGQILRTTASVGFACYPFLRSEPDRLDWQQVLAISDIAQYVSKRSSKNAFTGFFSTPTSSEIEDLFPMIREEPEHLIADGHLLIKTSIPSTTRVVFEGDETGIFRVESDQRQ
jgi:diguanylate cyclase (GGDEF)-like protein